LREAHEKITGHGVQILAVAPATPDDIADFLQVLGPYPFTIVGNPDLNLYEQLGNRRMGALGSLSYILGGIFSGRFNPRKLVPKEKDQRRIFFRAIKTQDVHIQGSSWLLDPGGKVIWKHVDENPEDHAKIDYILDAIQENVTN
jgi:hypothetical protein